MNVVGIGNLIVDYYFYDNKIYINGGGTIPNILCNLSSMNVKTKIIGYYGNDKPGMIAKESIEKMNVDTSLLLKKEYKTKCFFINPSGTSSYCPKCGKKFRDYKIRNNIKDYINNDDIILIQDYTILDDIPNKICLDFGYYNRLIYEDVKNIEKFIFRKYYMVNIKETVLSFILKKLNITFKEFKEKVDTYLLIITKGKNGASILFNDNIYNYNSEVFKEIETNGCGDIFFATFISEIIKRGNINSNDIKEIYDLAQKNVFKVISNIGARNHIVKNLTITKKDKCICEDFYIID